MSFSFPALQLEIFSKKPIKSIVIYLCFLLTIRPSESVRANLPFFILQSCTSTFGTQFTPSLSECFVVHSPKYSGKTCANINFSL